MFTRAAVSATIIVSALVGPAASTAAPVPSENGPRAGGLVAFTMQTHGRQNALFTVESSGGGLRQLTHPHDVRDDVTDFAWSPNGRRLLYAKKNAVWIMRPDGSHKTRLLGWHGMVPEELAWSPDGKRFAFGALNRAHQWRLWIYTFTTHQASEIDLKPFALSWSPDSRRLAFTFTDDNSRYQLAIYTLADGSVDQLTSFSKRQWEGAISPAWSPRGGPIIFVRQFYGDVYNHWYQLWSVSPDGQRLGPLTPWRRHSEREPAWAPGGHRFVNVAGYSPSESFISTALVVRRPDGTTIRRIRAQGDEAPSWSADGRWLLAIRPTENPEGLTFKNPGLWIVRADGTHAHRLIETTKDIAQAAWEPAPNP